MVKQRRHQKKRVVTRNRVAMRKRTTTRRRQLTRKQRGGAFSINSISPENEHETIVTIRPDSLEEDSIPTTVRLTVARKLLEDTDTGA